jgi:hypothetical protein
VLNGCNDFTLGCTTFGQPLSSVRMQTNGHAPPGPRSRAAKAAVEQSCVCGPQLGGRALVRSPIAIA